MQDRLCAFDASGKRRILDVMAKRQSRFSRKGSSRVHVIGRSRQSAQESSQMRAAS
jgi:hypothetical protein